MKAIIVEDEKLSAEHLANMLKRIGAEIEVVAYYDSVKKCLEEFKKGIKAELLFMDVHLADGLSFEIFSKMEIDAPVIFTTAYDEYAIKAFKVNSIDYLLKPIGAEDLKGALEKLRKIKSSDRLTVLDNIANAYSTLTKSYKNRFMVKTGDSISSIKTSDISHFLSEDGVVLLFTNTGKRYVIDYTLDTLERAISPEEFFRINRKVIIHINSVQKVSSYFNSRLKLQHPAIAEEDGVVSRERVSDFKAWLDR
ncbi:MAG: response regulator transcription factor [Bacteroidia bacterium]|nr:response regulator transcription factor [Bacteroidia bacterium]